MLFDVSDADACYIKGLLAVACYLDADACPTLVSDAGVGRCFV